MRSTIAEYLKNYESQESISQVLPASVIAHYSMRCRSSVDCIVIVDFESDLSSLLTLSAKNIGTIPESLL